MIGQQQLLVDQQLCIIVLVCPPANEGEPERGLKFCIKRIPPSGIGTVCLTSVVNAGSILLDEKKLNSMSFYSVFFVLIALC